MMLAWGLKHTWLSSSVVMSAYSSSVPSWPLCSSSAEACCLSTSAAAVTVGSVWALGLAKDSGSACKMSIRIAEFDILTGEHGACSFQTAHGHEVHAKTSATDAEGGTFVFASNVLCIWNSLLMHVRTLLCSSIASESERFPASLGTHCILTCWAGISAVSFSKNMASTCALSTVLTTKPSPA